MSKQKWKAFFNPKNGSLCREADGIDVRGIRKEPVRDPNKNCHYLSDGRGGLVYEDVQYIVMEPDQVYYGSLTVPDYSTYHEANSIELLNAARPGQTFPAHLKEIVGILQRASVCGGFIRGLWKVVKYGSLYSLSFVGDPDNRDEVMRLENIGEVGEWLKPSLC